MSKIEVNTVDVASGSTLTLGSSGKTIALASGTTNSINVKDIDWQAVVTADGSTNTTAEAGKGYFIDSSSHTHTINLPASPSIGDTVAIIGLDATTNNVTIGRNGSNIEGSASDLAMEASYDSVNLVYSDASNGWVRASKVGEDTFIVASGGTETNSGNYKVHTFNSSGNFVVSSLGNSSGGGDEVSYMVVAGGGGGGGNRGGGGGAGGFREGRAGNDSYGVSPLNAPSGITVTAQTYPITVGGAGSGEPGGTNLSAGTKGSASTFSTITSAGGGGGRDDDSPNGPGHSNGGSGGGGGGGSAAQNTAGAGNTPPVSPPQGNNGGSATGPDGLGNSGAGGGGATAVGTSNSGGAPLSTGGAGATTNISGSPVGYAGGGGAGAVSSKGPAPASEGGGAGGSNPGGPGNAGGSNKGGGGGGGGAGNGNGGNGGSGVVIIRYKYQ